MTTRRSHPKVLFDLGIALLVLTALFPALWPAAAGADAVPPAPLFPKPPRLEPNVEFWKRIYTNYGIGDFLLHDRENVLIIYDVVRVPETVNERRASDLAKPETQRLRAQYQDILSALAQGRPPEEFGPEGQRVAELWGCPCEPDLLLRAAGNIRVQQGLREKWDEGVRRARGMMPRIVSILQRHNVPVELAALPMVESTFNPAAHSKVGAAGLWQFIRSTGKKYLTITGKRDDRHDPIRSTEAAARLLKHNYEALGSWPLSIMAYNHGKAGIQTAREQIGSDAVEDIIARYNGPRFGFASRNFYPEFLAALELLHPTIREHAGQENSRKGS
jgi:peptidoglycan lytic transglycosylase D